MGTGPAEIAHHRPVAENEVGEQFGGLLMILPDALPMLQEQWPTIAPFIPDALESRVMNVIALGILLLRVRTTKSLADKVAK